MSKREILIIENEQDVIDMLMHQLRKTNEFPVATATDGEEGIVRARATQM